MPGEMCPSEVTVLLTAFAAAVGRPGPENFRKISCERALPPKVFNIRLGDQSTRHQPLFMTQTIVTEIFKRVTRFCALKRGNAINVAASLESPESLLISQSLRLLATLVDYQRFGRLISVFCR